MPNGIVGAGGTTEMAIKVAEVTVSVVNPLMPTVVAVIVDWPVVRLFAWPLLLTVTTAAGAEFQLTELLRSSVLPSA